MFVRLTYFSLDAEKKQETLNAYHEEIAPVIHQQPGIIDVMLLEPVQSDDEFISCTIWNSESDIKAFEGSDVYKDVFAKIKNAATKPAFQKYYKAARH